MSHTSSGDQKDSVSHTSSGDQKDSVSHTSSGDQKESVSHISPQVTELNNEHDAAENTYNSLVMQMSQWQSAQLRALYTYRRQKLTLLHLYIRNFFLTLQNMCKVLTLHVVWRVRENFLT